jgi:hypothetical protein
MKASPEEKMRSVGGTSRKYISKKPDPEPARRKEPGQGVNGHDKTQPELDFAALVAELDIHHWAELDVPKEERLLGELITPGTRTFLIGTTGIGKTLFGYEIVAAMAAGTGFLHWSCDRPSRWLVIDGEMPTILIKSRINDIRARHKVPAGNMLLYSAGRAEEMAKLIPALGEMPPLNTPEGHAWVMRVARILKVEGILFDNLMSLSPGNHTELDAWLKTVPLVAMLSIAGIAQVWLDHSGWDGSRQFGTSSKAWRFDSAGNMKPLPEDQRQTNETAFTLSFEPPGKARRRTPENWRDFQPHTIRLADGQWSSEPAAAPPKGLTQEAQGWLKDITNAFAIPDFPQSRTVLVNGLSCVRLTLSREQLRHHLRQCGRIGDESHGNLTGADRQKLRHWLNKLKDNGRIGVASDHIWLL